VIKNYLKTSSFYLIIFILLLQAITDTDFGWHLAVGKFIFETKSIPTHDLFSFTLPNYQYIYHSWASYLAVFLSYKIAGFAGVSALYSFILTLSVFFLIKIIKTLYQKNINLFLILTTTPLILSISGARPRASSFLFFSIIYYLFLKFANEKSKTIYFVPFIFFLWVNFHGSFLIGLLTFTLFIVISAISKDINTSQIKTLIKVLGFSLLATLINPYFYGAWKQALEISFNSSLNLRNINIDWKPLVGSGGTGWIFASFIVLTVIAIYKLKIKIGTREKTLLLIFFISSLYTARFTLPLLVFYLPSLHLLFYDYKKVIDQKILNLAPVKIAFFSLTLIIILIAFSNILQIMIVYKTFENYSYFLQTRSPSRFYYASWPYNSSQFVVDQFSDKNILCDANWSGYLLLLNPNIKVFYYGAMDNYLFNNTSFAAIYLNLINGYSPAQITLDKYNVDIIFLPPAHKIVNNLRSNLNWHIVMEDEKAVVFSKN